MDLLHTQTPWTPGAGAGIEIKSKPLSGPTVTFADVTLVNTARVKLQSSSLPWVRGAPILMMDGGGGIGGVWVRRLPMA